MCVVCLGAHAHMSGYVCTCACVCVYLAGGEEVGLVVTDK